MLPYVKINFVNGALGLVAASADGVLGWCFSGATVGSTFILATPYVLYGYKGLAALGITALNNPSIEKGIREFYNESGDGRELWIMGFPDTVLMSAMVDQTQAYAKLLINAANGRLRGLIVSRKPAIAYVPTIANGLDSDVALALTNAQVLSLWATATKYAPLFVLIEGYAYSGNPVDLTDLTLGSSNRCSILIGDTVVSSKSAAMGLLGGRLAKSPVQRNIGRVRDGALSAAACFIGANAVEVADVESLNNKGYITFRTFVGRSGYFFNDDFTATLPTDDYSHITARRTADKAYRIAYGVLLDLILDEVPINSDGTLQLAMVKSWEALVENAIATQMTANGELSADVTNPADKGVNCFIDPSQNVASTSIFTVGLRVRPFGYPRYVIVNLGFTVSS